MLSCFYSDLAIGQQAEKIVLERFSALTDKYKFEAVGDNPLYFHNGDIKAIDKETGKEVFIEVKNDSRIAETRNVLCEEEVEYYRRDYIARGNMYSNYEIYCVVSEQEEKIYVIDFSLLFKHYRKGEYKIIRHPQQATYCYLCSLEQIKQWGALIDVIDFN